MGLVKGTVLMVYGGSFACQLAENLAESLSARFFCSIEALMEERPGQAVLFIKDHRDIVPVETRLRRARYVPRRLKFTATAIT